LARFVEVNGREDEKDQEEFNIFLGQAENL
jgi:hypothetical protein